MKHIGVLFLTYYFSLIINIGYSQNHFTINWQKCFGGTQTDFVGTGKHIYQCSDGGFIIGASSESIDGDLTINFGSQDFWIFKLNSSGDLIWQKSFGSANYELLASIIETNDGGIAFVGDNLLYKLDGDGNIEWQYTCLNATGGLNDVIQTSDLGYIITGESQQLSGAYSDILIQKLDINGNLLWNQNYDGNNKDDYANEIVEMATGELLFLGGAFSSNSKTDIWIMKLMPNGNLIWEKFYGNTGLYRAWDIESTSDGGFVFTGMKPTNPWSNVLIVKLDGLGNTIWEQFYGGNDIDYGCSIKQTSDGGFIITGFMGTGYSIPTHSTDPDLWIAKLNSNGIILHEGLFGGTNLERGFSVITTSDSNFVVIGDVMSNDGDVVGFNEGNIWVVKFSESILGTQELLIDSDIKLIKVTDILGREIPPASNIVQFYQFSNGEMKRKLIIE
jgi:hypothetical protein